MKWILCVWPTILDFYLGCWKMVLLLPFFCLGVIMLDVLFSHYVVHWIICVSFTFTFYISWILIILYCFFRLLIVFYSSFYSFLLFCCDSPFTSAFAFFDFCCQILRSDHSLFPYFTCYSYFFYLCNLTELISPLAVFETLLAYFSNSWALLAFVFFCSVQVWHFILGSVFHFYVSPYWSRSW